MREAASVLLEPIMRAEIQQRATSLRTLTQGRDTMSVRSGHYDEVPALVQQQILEG
jgi:translation elongation factor EF-G